MNIDEIKYVEIKKGVTNIVGNTYGKLVVLGYAGAIKKHRSWYCKCRCGNIKIIAASSLEAKLTKSCGCLKGESHGLSNTTEYTIWANIKQRCYNPKNTHYASYGGRGIKMSDSWKNSFMNFYRDMGRRPTSLTIERLNNDKGYCKDNCIWATRKVQVQNRRGNILVNHKGKEICLIEYCSIMNLKYKTILSRISDRGWSLEKAITTPIRTILSDDIVFKGELISLRVICKRLNLNLKTIKKRIRQLNWSVEKALTTPIRPY